MLNVAPAALLTIALLDGMGIPLALADPQITMPGATQEILAALRELLHPPGGEAAPVKHSPGPATSRRTPTHASPGDLAAATGTTPETPPKP